MKDLKQEQQSSLLDEMIEGIEKPIERPSQATPRKQEPDTARQAAMDMAIAIGENPSQLAIKRDMGTILERMKEGVLVELHISRPRGNARIDLSHLGVSLSEEAAEVVSNYFRLGRRSLFPKPYRDALDRIEAAARAVLDRYSFKTPWGSFIPVTRYSEWKEKNSEKETEFWALREKMLSEYEQILEQVVEDHRPLAYDAWKNAAYTAAKQIDDDTIAGLLTRLSQTQDKETFVTNYLECVRVLLPTKESIEDGFSYIIERGIVPLPSLVAKDKDDADRLYQERAIQEAETQAKLDAIEQTRRAEQRKLSLEQQLEEQKLYDQLYRERERQRAQLQMERDIVDEARRQKERILQEFYTGIVEQMNKKVSETTGNILEAIDRHGGIIRGPVSAQLSNLVKVLEQMNFIEDETIESQIARLKEVLPTPEQQTQARKGLARIDTSAIARVLRVMHDEAQSVSIELSTTPQTRRKRAEEITPIAPIDLGERRTRRDDVMETTIQREEQPARRRRTL